MSILFLKGLEQSLLGNIDMESDTIKCAFMSTSYSPDAGTDQFYSDISSDVASGTTDLTLANVDVRIDTGNSRVELDADNLSDTGVTASTDKFVIYKDTGTASTSTLIACLDIAEGTLNPINGTLSITLNAEGIYAITSA